MKIKDYPYQDIEERATNQARELVDKFLDRLGNTKWSKRVEVSLESIKNPGFKEICDNLLLWPAFVFIVFLEEAAQVFYYWKYKIAQKMRQVLRKT